MSGFLSLINMMVQSFKREFVAIYAVIMHFQVCQDLCTYLIIFGQICLNAQPHFPALIWATTIAPSFQSSSGGFLRRNHKIHQLGLTKLQSRNLADSSISKFSPKKFVIWNHKKHPSGQNHSSVWLYGLIFPWMVCFLECRNQLIRAKICLVPALKVIKSLLVSATK